MHGQRDRENDPSLSFCGSLVIPTRDRGETAQFTRGFQDRLGLAAM